MWKAKVKSRTNGYGVSKIRRSTYNTKNGMAVKGGWWTTIAEVKKRDNGLCVPCFRAGKRVPMTEVHHIRPLSQGGTNDKSNLMSVCNDCHDKRHSHLFMRGRK